MRRRAGISFVLLMLLLGSAASAQGKYRAGQLPPVDQNPKDYTIKIHIFTTRFRSCDLNDVPCYEVVYADSTVDGKKVELYFAIDDKHQLKLVVPGDYSAKLFPAKKMFAGGAPVLFQDYVILLPNKTALYPQITGILE